MVDAKKRPAVSCGRHLFNCPKVSSSTASLCIPKHTRPTPLLNTKCPLTNKMKYKVEVLKLVCSVIHQKSVFISVWFIPRKSPHKKALGIDAGVSITINSSRLINTYCEFHNVEADPSRLLRLQRENSHSHHTSRNQHLQMLFFAQ